MKTNSEKRERPTPAEVAAMRRTLAALILAGKAGAK